jgi:hypothetical protein
MPVPKIIFEDTWLKGNFLIPADGRIRRELRKQLETYSRDGVMFIRGNEGVLSMLKARIAAIDAYGTAE